MEFRAGRGWGMPFIVSPNYVPQDPEWEKHYKPEQQGCADCNGVKVPPQNTFFTRDVLTCNGMKAIQTTRRPNIPPMVNREMDKQYLGVIQTVTKTRVVNRSTRSQIDVDTTVIDVTNDL